MAIAILLVAFAAVVGTYLLILRAGGFRFPWFQFYVRGKESGFSFSEVNLLRRVAIENKLKNPTSLFWSVKTLDRCIRSAIIGFRAAGSENDQKSQEFLNKLFDFRRRVEFDQPKYRLGISSTRSIEPGQTFRIVLEGGGIYISKLVENNRKHLAITYPRGNPLPHGFSWRDQELKLHFWRKEDAGYFFEAKVLGDYLDRKVPILHLSHSDNLIRAQKRRSVRRTANVPGTLFPLRSIQQANETVETRGGYRCKLIDLSEDGAAMVIGGRAKAGLPVKIQVKINDDFVVLCGTIKSVTFRQKNNASILHLEAKPPSIAMRIRILTFVYGLFSDAESVASHATSTPAVATSAGQESSTAPSHDAEQDDTGEEAHNSQQSV
ncbi:MAG TPA: PilZ domain-containing protein [Alkalispirochaeta sp.]|nr:PilZ domain-containing protein [Alkalispirochaeta sp.]